MHRINEFYNVSNFSSMVMPIITAGITFLAGWVGAIYGIKQVKTQKRLDFIEKQLREFYSPILGIHKEIEALGSIRLKIQKSGDKVFSVQPNEVLQRKIEGKVVENEIDYNNSQLTELVLPRFHKMLDLFRVNMGLAEPETILFYIDLVEFVEIWDRWLAKSMDADIIKDIGHSEERLKEFYKDLEKHSLLLRKELSQ